MMALWILLHLTALCSVLLALRSDLHAFQQFGYYRAPFFRWKKEHRFYGERTLYALGLALSVTALLLPAAPRAVLLSISLAMLLLHLFFQRLIERAYPPKKALVYTGRVKRMAVTATLLLLAAAPLYLLHPACVTVWMLLALFGSDALVLAADVLNQPIERHINNGFYRDAQRKIAEAPFLKVIAITGSYGKTSTKNIVASLLSPYVNTLASPASYNTKLGLTRTIRASLIPTTQVFVAEMGAKRLGEIEEIVDFLTPDLALITSIGEQHLETFLSLDNIVAEKTQVFQKLRSGGCAFINEEDPVLSRLTLRDDVRRIGYSFSEHSDFYLKDIVTSGTGSSCTLVDRAAGTQTQLWTSLLGKHNLLNILAGAAIAITLGISPEQVASAVSMLKPVTNRLSTRTERGVLILEDAFNSNPVGAKAALDVLQSMAESARGQGGQGEHSRERALPQRIIMTPGMIELADKEREVHTEFGRQIAAVCDRVILVSARQTRHIREGLEAAGYDMTRVVTVPTMAEAFRVMRDIAAAGDIVLIENDLPDAWEEKA